MCYTNRKIKINALWQLNEAINLIDLGYDYYLIKFQQPGPWFIGSQYLTFRQWESKFNPTLGHANYTTVWIRLHELLSEYYDLQILQKIATFVGALIKIDTCTMHTSRGRYARLCILAPLGKTLATEILLGTHTQLIHYGDPSMICTKCGCLGHTIHYCPTITTASTSIHAQKYPNPIYM